MTSSKREHLPQLDGLRGVAVLIVLIGHLLVFQFGMGISVLGPLPPVGVDIFFVLSGFLITRILLESRGSSGYFKTFYIKRALRIWPLYFLVITLLFAVTNHRIAGLTFDERRIHWQVFAVLMQNLVYLRPKDWGPLALAITWSLAVEEQFYLIWPIVVRKLRARGLVVFLGLVILIAPLARALAPRFGVDPYINPLCRFDSMAIGSLVALFVTVKVPSRLYILRVAAAMLIGAALVEAGSFLMGIEHYLSKTALSSLFGALLLGLLASKRLIGLFSAGWLRQTGQLSYCLYLVHPIVAGLVLPLLPAANIRTRGLRSLVVVTLSFGIAAASWKWFEGPILGLKAFIARSPSADALKAIAGKDLHSGSALGDSASTL